MKLIAVIVLVFMSLLTYPHRSFASDEASQLEFLLAQALLRAQKAAEESPPTAPSDCEKLIFIPWRQLVNIDFLRHLTNQNIVASYRGSSRESLIPVTKHPVVDKTNSIYTSSISDQSFSEDGSLVFTPKNIVDGAPLSLRLTFYPTDKFLGEGDPNDPFSSPIFRRGKPGEGFRHALLAGDLTFLEHNPAVNLHIGYQLTLPQEFQQYLADNDLMIDSFVDSTEFSQALEIEKIARSLGIDPEMVESPFSVMRVGGTPSETHVSIGVSFGRQTPQSGEQYSKLYSKLLKVIESKMPYLIDPNQVKRPSVFQRLLGNAYVPKASFSVRGSRVTVLTDLGYITFELTRYIPPSRRSTRIIKM